MLTAILPTTKTTATYSKPEELRSFQIVKAEVTKYSSEPGQTDDSPFITANGDYVGKGTIACPARFAFGTEIEIDGQTYFCNDRMAERYRAGNYFDVWTESTPDAIEWGRRQKEIKIFE
jgi:3D (Asp-Asp-Asp) domain-containing protein